MKRSNMTSNNLVTKVFFKKELKNELKKELNRFTTKKELKAELSKYATKADLKKEIETLEIRVKIMMDDLKQDMDITNRKYRDDILNAIDPVLKEIIIAREDRAISAHQVAELRDKVDNHEKRISKLE